MNYLVYPIHISPTKPWTPNHIRHLFQADLIYKAYHFCGFDSKYIYNRLTMDITRQVIAFESYMRNKGYSQQDYLDKDDFWLGKMYVKAHKKTGLKTNTTIIENRAKELELTLKKLDFYDAIIPHWLDYHKLLNLYEPGIDQSKKYLMSTNDLLEFLKSKDVLLDMRDMYASTYLDLTDFGLPLKQLTTHSIYQNNYFVSILRTIIPMAQESSAIVFIYDQEMSYEYQLIKVLLESIFSAKFILFETQRVMLEGKKLSSRYGGWEPYVFPKLLNKYSTLDKKTFNLGLKMYLLGEISYKKESNFDFTLLDRCFDRSAQYLKQMTSIQCTCELKKILSNKINKEGFVNPSFLTHLITNTKTDPVVRNSTIQSFFI